MFTGIIQARGKVVQVTQSGQQAKLTIETSLVSDGTFKLGDSIAVNGVCLTVTDLTGTGFSADVMPETMLRTNFNQLASDAFVNLEPSLSVGQKLDGHFVLGHVDTTATLVSTQADEDSIRLRFQIGTEYEPYIVEKGSVAINGISLTVVSTSQSTFEVALIPYTLTHTNLSSLKQGDSANIETDILGKYIVNMAKKGLTEKWTQR